MLGCCKNPTSSPTEEMIEIFGHPVMKGQRTRELFRVAAPLLTIGLSMEPLACAPMTPYNPDRLPLAQMSRVGEICNKIMGLPASQEVYYQTCEESLSHSVAARREKRSVIVRQYCEARGLRPEALAQCRLYLPRAMWPQADQALDAALPTQPATDYFSASNDEVRRREQAACVAIGEHPATSAFAQCVVDLDASFFAIDDPIWNE
jgi:hypothetical protein